MITHRHWRHEDRKPLSLNAASKDKHSKIITPVYGAVVVTSDSQSDDDFEKDIDDLNESNQAKDERVPVMFDDSSLIQHKVQYATRISLLVNVTLLLVKLWVFGRTGSFAVMAALTDSFCDLVSQLILLLTQKAVRRPSPRFPAGRTRLEPLGILIMATLMMLLSLSVVAVSLLTLYNTYVAGEPLYIRYSLWSVLLMIASIVSKLALWMYCKRFVSSPSAMALAQDHRNDVLSNSTALLAVLVATGFGSSEGSRTSNWVDPVGGMLISVYIIASWLSVAKDEGNKLIGIEADDEEMGRIKALIAVDGADVDTYSLDAYYSGTNVLCELRLVLRDLTDPARNMAVDYKRIVDGVLALQQKIEGLSFVERAFVNFDYQKRSGSLHKNPVRN